NRVSTHWSVLYLIAPSYLEIEEIFAIRLASLRFDSFLASILENCSAIELHLSSKSIDFYSPFLRRISISKTNEIDQTIARGHDMLCPYPMRPLCTGMALPCPLADLSHSQIKT
ncbi:MAG: hypothetical protein DCF14_23900, partial [Phormidesmis priestleyi]